jgi:hypothetical protein
MVFAKALGDLGGSVWGAEVSAFVVGKGCSEGVENKSFGLRFRLGSNRYC